MVGPTTKKRTPVPRTMGGPQLIIAPSFRACLSRFFHVVGPFLRTTPSFSLGPARLPQFPPPLSCGARSVVLGFLKSSSPIFIRKILNSSSHDFQMSLLCLFLTGTASLSLERSLKPFFREVLRSLVSFKTTDFPLSQVCVQNAAYTFLIWDCLEVITCPPVLSKALNTLSSWIQR